MNLQFASWHHNRRVTHDQHHSTTLKVCYQYTLSWKYNHLVYITDNYMKTYIQYKPNRYKPASLQFKPPIPVCHTLLFRLSLFRFLSLSLFFFLLSLSHLFLPFLFYSLHSLIFLLFFFFPSLLISFPLFFLFSLYNSQNSTQAHQLRLLQLSWHDNVHS